MSLMCETAPNPLVLDLQGEPLFTLFDAAKKEMTCLHENLNVCLLSFEKNKNKKGKL